MRYHGLVPFLVLSIFAIAWAGESNVPATRPTTTSVSASGGEQTPDYLALVQRYADAMLESGRDHYGRESSPLFSGGLDRRTLEPGPFPGIPGVSRERRVTTGGNPLQGQSLYRVMYALSVVTGNKTYAEEADKTLRWFFEHCQSPKTGLFAWGEHMGWDFYTETPLSDQYWIRDVHEFSGPWVLWDRSFRLAPEPCAKFARGLWEHAIGDQSTGNFSRHAQYASHRPFINSQFPRHGGFYIMTWAAAYQHTKDPVLLKAIETVLSNFTTRRNPNTGAIPCESDPRTNGKMVWPESTLSLAVDLENSAAVAPEPLAGKMRDAAAKIDEVYQKLSHDFSPKGIGFVAGCDADTLQACTTGYWTHSQVWGLHYGVNTDAQIALMAWLRHNQLPEGPAKAGYRKLILASAERYLQSEPDMKKDAIYPTALAAAIFHMLAAHDLSGRKEFRERAEHFASLAAATFFDADSPLPKASSQHSHYEVSTGPDELVMALLKLWQVQNRPGLDLDLVYQVR